MVIGVNCVGAYLCHESRTKASLVFVTGWNPFHHTWAWVVQFTGPATSWAHVQYTRQQFGLKAESGIRNNRKCLTGFCSGVCYNIWVFIHYSILTYFMPRFIVSAVPIMEMPKSMLLQILAAWPVPTPPQWTTFLPMFPRISLALSKLEALPPTIKVNRASRAATTPTISCVCYSSTCYTC